MGNEFLVNYRDIQDADSRIRPLAKRTRVTKSEQLDKQVGKKLFFKLENEQTGGSFKIRGSTNALKKLLQKEEDLKTKGVITYSSGNHAQGLSRAAQELGIPATIVMPEDAPKAKIDATQNTYKAEIVFYKRGEQSREEIGLDIAKKQGSFLIPPFDHPDIIAGQGTAALEFFQEVPDMDVFVAPLGGGGLTAGSAIALKHLNPNIKIIGVEPEAGNDWQQSFAKGERVQLQNSPKSIADGLLSTAPGEITFPIVHKLIDGVVTVSEQEIVNAMNDLLTFPKITAEPSGAAATAAVLSGKVQQKLNELQSGLADKVKTIGIMVSGGNFDWGEILKPLAQKN